MHLSELEKTDEYLLLKEHLPTMPLWVKYVACLKTPNSQSSLYSLIKFGGVMFLICIAFGVSQVLLSLFFWGWFGLTRLTATYTIALFFMLGIFLLVNTVGFFIKGMSASIDKTLSNAKLQIAVCFLILFLLMKFYQADDYAMVITVEFMAVFIGLESIFSERNIDKSKTDSLQYEEFINVRILNYKLLKLKKQLNKNDVKLKASIDALYSKSAQVESELKQYLYVI